MKENAAPVRALVLAGGGAKGSYHVGVYRALQQLGWVPDIITGASVGALNGVLFTMGKVQEADLFGILFVIKIVVKKIYLGTQSCIVKGCGKNLNKSYFLFNIHEHSSSFVVSVSRFILWSHRMDCYSVVFHRFQKPYEIVRIVRITSFIQMSAYIVIIRNIPIFLTHLHPFRSSPWCGNDFQLGVDGLHFF